MRAAFRLGERLTFCDCGDCGSGLQGLQREKRPESVMKRHVSGSVEESLFQSVDGVFHRGHRTTFQGWLKPQALGREDYHYLKKETIKEGDSHDWLHLPHLPIAIAPVDVYRDESHMTN